MPNIKDLEMAAAVSADERISIRRSLFGLVTKAVYLPTQSVVNISINEYSPAEGDKLLRLLSMPMAKLQQELSAVDKPRKADIGHYRLECCLSADHRFCALQLFRFGDFKYAPATDLLTYEGGDAELISQIL